MLKNGRGQNKVICMDKAFFVVAVYLNLGLLNDWASELYRIVK